MNTLIKQVHRRFGIVALSLAMAFAISVSVAAVVSQTKDKSLSGNWALYILLDGNSNDQQSPTTVTFVEAGNKLSGKVLVPEIINTSTGPQRGATITEMVLTNLKFNGKELSFRVITGEDSVACELTKVSDDNFNGSWESPIGERWKSSKNKFTGTVKMLRMN